MKKIPRLSAEEVMYWIPTTPPLARQILEVIIAQYMTNTSHTNPIPSNKIIRLQYTVRKKFRRVMWIDGVSVRLTANTATIEGDKEKVMAVAFHLPKWLHDGIFEGSYIGTYRTGIAYE